MFSDFVDFIVAVFWRWQSWAGGSGFGGAVVVFITLYQQLSGRTMPKRVYIAIVVVGFLVGAFFMAWRDQYHAALGARAQLRDLTEPQLILSVDELGVGEMEAAGLTHDRSVCYCQSDEQTAHMRTATAGLYLILAERSSVAKVRVNPSTDLTSRDQPGSPTKFTMPLSDSLYTKAMERTIERGMKIRGLLIFPSGDVKVPDVQKEGIPYVLSCQDVNGKTVTFRLAFKDARVLYSGIEA